MKGGRNDPHRRTRPGEEQRAWPMLAIDYGYLKNNPPAEGNRQREVASGSDDLTGSEHARRGGTCILFGTEARHDLSLAMVVPAKGSAAEWISKRIAGWIDRLGSRKCTLKMDNEPAIVALGREIARKWSIQRRQRAKVTLTQKAEWAS